ncbi:hypothetical protein OAX32_03005 [Flavobacteriales bacterium]|nr:hypothetical protein [Flavobacteriales bacterium]
MKDNWLTRTFNKLLLKIFPNKSELFWFRFKNISFPILWIIGSFILPIIFQSWGYWAVYVFGLPFFLYYLTIWILSFFIDILKLYRFGLKHRDKIVMFIYIAIASYMSTTLGTENEGGFLLGFWFDFMDGKLPN